MAVSPKEFYKLREENKCLRQIVSNKVVEIDKIMLELTKGDVTDYVTVILEGGLSDKICKDIAEEYIEAGWDTVYYRINFGKVENTTEFVFCTKLGSHNFVRDVINKQELKYDVVKKKRIT